MLGTIFAVEAGFLGFAFWKCSQPIPGSPAPIITERCPKIGERSETLFVAAVSVTLSLLTGAGVVAASQQSQSSSDDRVSSERGQDLRQPPQRKE